MLAAYGLGNVLGCDVNDLVCLEVACGSGMTVNPDASTRGVAPCVPQCPAGQTLNTSNLTCEVNADIANLLTPIDSGGPASGGSLGPAASAAIAGPGKWLAIAGALGVAVLGVLMLRYYARSPS